MKLTLVLLFLVSVSWAQNTIDRNTNASINPCPGGAGTAELDVVPVPSLDRLVLLSNLIVAGTVINVLPSFNMDPKHLGLVETDSEVSVTQTILGNKPLGTILVFQHGGKAGPCTIVVPDDPLLKSGDQYILFLLSDNRKAVPNSSGIPRYQVVGFWSGKAQIVDGKIRFPPRAGAMHKYDNMDVASFLATLRNTIGILSDAKLLRP